MTAETVATGVRVSRGALWTGRVMSGLVLAFLAFDAAIKLVPLDIVLETSRQIGLPDSPGFARGLGILLAVLTILYAIPRTAPIGAILLTGYLGGALLTHLRIGSPIFSHLLFGIYVGALMWGGLALRDLRVRALLPIPMPR